MFKTFLHRNILRHHIVSELRREEKVGPNYFVYTLVVCSCREYWKNTRVDSGS